MLTTLLPSCMNDCGRPLKRLRCSPHQRHRDRSGTMIGKLTPFHLSQVTWSWLKPMPTRGGERWRSIGRRNHMKWSAKMWKASLPTSWKTSRLDAHGCSTEINFFSLLQWTHHLVQAKQARCTTIILEEQTQKSETEEAPQGVNCPLLVWHETGKTPLGLVNRRPCAFIQTFAELPG